MKNQYYTTLQTPMGEIALTASDEGLTGLYPAGHRDFKKAQRGIRRPEIFQPALRQLEEYFQGRRRDFDLALAPEGTDFQKKVWKALVGIGYGQTKSYGEVARLIRSPQASRAVGLANSRNPLCIIVPCHRVVGSGGKLTGYAGGLEAKKWLLDHEAGQPQA